jgi:hypothetical protein
MTSLCTADVSAYLAGVLQLDELRLQQDPLFRPFLQNKEKVFLTAKWIFITYYFKKY